MAGEKKKGTTAKTLNSSSIERSEDGERSRKDQKKLQLLDDDDDDDDLEGKEEVADTKQERVRINESYAQQYQERKAREEVQRSLGSKALFFNSDDEDGEELSSDDEVAEELTEDVDTKINETIRMIRERDPRIYQPDFKPFNELENRDAKTTAETTLKSKKTKEFTYKDMVREHVLKGGAEESEDEDESEKVRGSDKSKNKSYVEEQEEAKEQFKKALQEQDEPDEEDDNEFGLKAKCKATPLPPPSSRKQSAKTSSADDEFLWKYINDRAWMKDGDHDDPRNVVSSSSIAPSELKQQLEEDEEELEKAEEFEQAFNFRYQDPSATTIVTHARQIEGSLRRKEESSRQKQRTLKQERKEQERKQKITELKRLKQLKRELLEKELQKAFAKGGTGAAVGLTPEDLEADFDPATWDAKMAQAFGDEYYAQEDEELDRGLETADVEVKSNKDGEHDEEIADDGEVDEEEDERKLELIRRIAQERVDEELGDEEQIAKDEGKFRYRKVQPNDFGLTDEEIWAANNAELNAFVSLKRMAPYAEKEWHASAKHRQRFRQLLKKRMANASSSSSSGTKSKRPSSSSSFFVDQHRNKKKQKTESSSSASAAAAAPAPPNMSAARLKSFGRA